MKQPVYAQRMSQTGFLPFAHISIPTFHAPVPYPSLLFCFLSSMFRVHVSGNQDAQAITSDVCEVPQDNLLTYSDLPAHTAFHFLLLQRSLIGFPFRLLDGALVYSLGTAKQYLTSLKQGKLASFTRSSYMKNLTGVAGKERKQRNS